MNAAPTHTLKLGTHGNLLLLVTRVLQNSKMSAFNKANSALDSLEKELGIDLGFDFESDALGNTSHSSLSKSDDRSIASAPPKSATNNGMIHSHWLTTFFAGSLPAAQSAMLLDWALFNGERYAGTSSPLPPLASRRMISPWLLLSVSPPPHPT